MTFGLELTVGLHPRLFRLGHFAARFILKSNASVVISPPDPIDAIKFRMEQMGMTKTDMAKYLGSQSRVNVVLSRKRKLTLKMVKSLYKGLKIPAEILLA